MNHHIFLVLILWTAICGGSWGSANIEMTQPVLKYDDPGPNGRVFFGVLAGDTYLSLWLHHVTQQNSDGFTDLASELGIVYRSGITLFARYQILHDLDRFDGIADGHVLIGTRYVW